MQEIHRTRENRRYLPGIAVPPGALATADAGEALAGAGIVIVAVPSQFVEAVRRRDEGRHRRSGGCRLRHQGARAQAGRAASPFSLGDVLPGHPLAVLSGPSFAREVALGQPTALVIAASDECLARDLQQALAAPAFRLYTNRDVIGVEIAGALKNVMAIATGLCDGLALGENARAALITRGLAEIARLGYALGARPATFLGLAGLGDLVLTCTGSFSRNRALGLEIARGRPLGAGRGGDPDDRRGRAHRVLGTGTRPSGRASPCPSVAKWARCCSRAKRLARRSGRCSRESRGRRRKNRAIHDGQLSCHACEPQHGWPRSEQRGTRTMFRPRSGVALVPELRRDPVVGRWVIISTERARRPADFSSQPLERGHGPCVFCPGQESRTPDEVWALRPAASAPNSPGWRVRVVPNRFPALRIEGELEPSGEGLYDRMNGVGAHEVVIEAPEHTPGSRSSR